MADDCCSNKSRDIERLARQAAQRRVLLLVMAINAAMFVIEFGAGVIAGSAALMADSVDMLGDALVYALSLYAIARSDRWKGGAALAKGGFILLFGIGVLIEIAVKITTGLAPQSTIMLAFAALALLANLACLRLLWRFRAQDVNMASTFECSRNDVVANCGVIAAAIGVALSGSPWPDIVVAGVIAAIFLRSAIRVIGAAVPALRHA
jgi:Co/Zn/Cd efflux system component